MFDMIKPKKLEKGDTPIDWITLQNFWNLKVIKSKNFHAPEKTGDGNLLQLKKELKI